MRSYMAEVRDTRTFAQLFDDAMATLRQDNAEYGLIGITGGVIAAMMALVMRTAGGPLVVAAIVPFVALVALLTLATTTAALRRVDENLPPDASRALLGAVVRLPFMLVPLGPPMLIAFASVVAASYAGRYVPDALAFAGGTALVLVSAAAAFRYALFVPALFARGSSARAAAPLSEQMIAGARLRVAMAWLLPLAPAHLIALVSALLGFGVMSSGLTAFAYAASMPLVAAVSWMQYQQLERYADVATPAPAPVRGPPAVSERLTRHVR